MAAQTEERWFCIATIATGFVFDEQTKKWREAHFDIADSKYILAKNTSGSYIFQQVGANYGAPCTVAKAAFFCNFLEGEKGHAQHQHPPIFEVL